MKILSIGQLSTIASVKVPTIRYYESIGLLPKPRRSDSNRRYYNHKDAERLAFIRHARDLGFEIEDIRALLAMTETPQVSCHAADSIALRHINVIKEKILALTVLNDEMERMVRECKNGKIAECRVISVISAHHLCQTDIHKRV